MARIYVATFLGAILVKKKNLASKKERLKKVKNLAIKQM